ICLNTKKIIDFYGKSKTSIQLFKIAGYIWIVTVTDGKVASEIRSGKKSYIVDEEFTSFIEEIIKKYSVSRW
ncbi:MAG TPA: hypothetical protein PLH43_03845, partial [Acetivibrio sp.]|uniref:hypothetical protein n=1 Tax=Acetivibrio sp. TaxID=1872092 RepID=UPI002CD82810